MKNKRKQLITWLFLTSERLYRRFKKKQPWGLTDVDLLNMPANTYGYQLGCFLHANGFQLIPKVERHDAYHVLTGFGPSQEDEIALQYLCFGNGKRTPYLFAVLVLGTLILPDYFRYYRKAFRLGKQAHSFHHFDFKKILPLDFNFFRSTIFSEESLRTLEQLHGNSVRPPLTPSTL
jgi:ubiquinone biosynthesis protein Coq4